MHICSVNTYIMEVTCDLKMGTPQLSHLRASTYVGFPSYAIYPAYTIYDNIRLPNKKSHLTCGVFH